MLRGLSSRLAAQEGLERIVLRIAEQDLEAAKRFVDAVEASIALMAEIPEAGPLYETENAPLAGRVPESAWVAISAHSSTTLGSIGRSKSMRLLIERVARSIRSTESRSK